MSAYGVEWVQAAPNARASKVAARRARKKGWRVDQPSETDGVGGFLLDAAAGHARRYLDSVGGRMVGALVDTDALRTELAVPLADAGDDARQVIDILAGMGRDGTVASQGPRYFGFVTGSSLPVATAADWLVSAWDQNAGLHVMSPLAGVVEDVVRGWILSLLDLPPAWSVGYVTGGQMANFTALAAARHHVLHAVGWDVEANGMGGAPPIDVLASEEAHYTIARSLAMLGLGHRNLRTVPTDGQGRMRAQALERLLADRSGPCIVCAQAGNVNTGAFDPVDVLADLARERGAWLHVDGAFGLWARASGPLRHLAMGVERADSLATDGHKWLNVPYDCGMVLCAHPRAHRDAMTLSAAYIQQTARERDGRQYVPEESRRARAVPVYAVLRTLGRSGVADLVERCCGHARRFAEGLQAAGYEVLNEVVLNQVLVAFGDAETTRRVVAAVQADGTCWCGGTEWHGRAAMRISISSWATTAADVDQSLAAIIRLAGSIVR